MVTLNQTLSVYGLVKNTSEDSELINNVRVMRLISREIEDVVIHGHVKARVFAGFQRMSSFLPQAKRYQELARFAESVYVFGHYDVNPPPLVNVRYINIQPDDQLAREWFLIADSPDYFTGLVTEELPSQNPKDPNRKFHGIWSFDEELVEIIQAWLSDLVKTYPLEIQHRKYEAHIRHMSQTVNRLTQRISKQQP